MCQLLIMSDCLLRNMYEVEHLVINDLDEIILPVEHDNWTEMLNFNGSWRYASYTFQNAFFYERHPSPPVRQPLRNCTMDLRIPNYFTSTERVQCFPGYKYRTKFIARPRLALLPIIHTLCTGIAGYIRSYNMPAEVGINAHYRFKIPRDCSYVYNKKENYSPR